jgi:hypothetical protein
MEVLTVTSTDKPEARPRRQASSKQDFISQSIVKHRTRTVPVASKQALSHPQPWRHYFSLLLFVTKNIALA